MSGIITRDPEMLRICRTIEKVAPTAATVLLLGESGTGKELLARALHDLSPRRAERFVAINCAAIPETLLESELFGYEKGAFTGAAQADDRQDRDRERRHAVPRRDRRPAAVAAGEAAALPAGARDRARRRPRGDPGRRAHRLRDAPESARTQIADGQFREDLYYRLAEIVVEIPPLRARHGRRGAARARLRAHVRRRAAPRLDDAAARRRRRDRGARLAGQRARARERASSAR